MTEAVTTTQDPRGYLAELRSALQGTAERARDDALEGLDAEATAAIDDLAEMSATTTAALRETALAEIAALREREAAEVERVRLESGRLISERERRLAEELEATARAADERIAAIRTVVERFRDEMDDFTDRLRAAEDPVDLAAIAASMPAPPPLPDVAGASVTSADDEARSDDAGDRPEAGAGRSDAAALDAAEAEAAHLAANGGGDGGSMPPTTPTTRRPATQARSRTRATQRPAARSVGAASAPPSEIGTLGDRVPAILSTDATAAASSEPGDGEVERTRLVVSGLVSLAGITGFRQGIARRPEIHSVGVGSTPAGEFTFDVVHDPDVALEAIIGNLVRFQPRVERREPGELAVLVVDPDAS